MLMSLFISADSHKFAHQLFVFMPKPMLSFGSIFLASVYRLILKIVGFISKYARRSNHGVVEENSSNFSENRSQKDDKVFSYSSTGFLSSGVAEKESYLDYENSKKDLGGNFAETGDSVFLQSGLISSCSKYEFVSGENVSFQLEEAKEKKCLVQEMFLGSDEAHLTKMNSFEQNLDKDEPEFDENSSALSFRFNLLNIDMGSADNRNLQDEKNCEEKEKMSSNDSKEFQIKGARHMKEEILDDQDFFYVVELLPFSEFSAVDENQESEIIGNDEIKPTNENEHDVNDKRLAIENFLPSMEKVEDSEDEYIEFKPSSANTRFCNNNDANISRESMNFDFSDDDEDENDVLWEHQNLVRQIKIEMKNCKVRGKLPTISEECEESPKMAEDLRPLEINHKIEYKDVMDEIHKFYKSYSEKMHKLDVLNYQTLHAMSFLRLKDSEVFTTSKKKGDLITFTNLPKLWPCKVPRIHTDPSQKSILEMNRDLELVYVGQLCLSSEILRWLYVKSRELLKHDCKKNHSYNRAAEEFQQFQVLLQRFMENEEFQGQRIQNYVRTRFTIRGLLQVPMIKDDCLKANKETRDEMDVISLEKLSEIIRESMLIFREFVLADKSSTNVVLKGIQGTKLDPTHSPNAELLVETISNLQKKERRIRDHIRSQKCIVKKYKKPEKCHSDMDLSTSQVELRLVSRVLFLSRLTTDQVLWCQNKLNCISFTGRKVYVEPCFLLFPC
ncbi:hypothetical protein STAS_21514 [Striga asiatica]|uniref:Ribosomal protein L34Ae n=1 Tax=Striga asiatica TaxID=4170 RepID=A0A5A7QHQ6_STRAF|nr:hypothetical protein STAS_21514 [Striga asiatica]